MKNILIAFVLSLTTIISLAFANTGSGISENNEKIKISELENKITALENKYQLLMTGSNFDDYEKILVESKYMSDKQRDSYERATENFTTWMNWFIWIFAGAFIALLIVLGVIKWKDFEVSKEAILNAGNVIKSAETRMIDIENRLVNDVLKSGIQDKLNDIFSDESKASSIVLELTKNGLFEKMADNIYNKHKGELNGKITEVLLQIENRNQVKINDIEKRLKFIEDKENLLPNQK